MLSCLYNLITAGNRHFILLLFFMKRFPGIGYYDKLQQITIVCNDKVVVFAKMHNRIPEDYDGLKVSSVDSRIANA